ncbi:solute carrier family 22 member 13-like [Antennarius striatus]|uniref:solute carrier family 22 member 13-like n=1 Tax=Antennarius striatus TaxID=241820 RepID=UPI0035B0224A
MSRFGPILKAVGEFGLFQKLIVIAICIPGIFSPFDTISQVFIGKSFPHHCNTDWILQHGPNLTEEEQKNLTLPVNEDGNFESCKMFTPVDWNLETIERFGINSTTGCTDGWDYEAPKGGSSMLTEFDLVCDKSSFIEVSQSIYMAGIFFGVLLFGTISDRFGRRCGILLSLLLQVLFGVAVAFSPNVYVYIVLKFFCGFSSSAIMIMLSVLAIEWTVPSRAATCTALLMTFYSVGLLVLSGIAYSIRNWRIMQLVLFSPLVLVLGVFYCFLPESARWLITQGRKEEALKVLQRAAQVNGRTMPEDLLDKLEMEDSIKRRNILDIFRIPYLRKRTVIMSCIWFASSLLYYGLGLNVGSFGVNIYLTQFVFGVVEFPANFTGWVLIQRLGRRLSQAGFLIFGGVTCLIILAIPKNLPVVITTIAVLGNFGSTASFNIAYVYSAELYPTVVRNNGVGLNSMCARVAGVLAPLVRLLDVFHDTIPMLVYGIIPIVAGGLCLLLPETLNVELEDHAEMNPPGEKCRDPMKDPMKAKYFELLFGVYAQTIVFPPTALRRREATLSSTGVNSNTAALSRGLMSIPTPTLCITPDATPE